jgi:hypothetical protein
MRLEAFVGPGDIDPEQLSDAVFAELVDGADPQQIVHFLTGRVELPHDEAIELVGQINAGLQERMQVVAGRLDERERPETLIRELVEVGWSEAQAARFVGRTREELAGLSDSAEGLDQLLAKTRRRFIAGLLWFAAGVAVTAFTQFDAERRGGGYALLAYGPILYGIILAGHSAIRWMKHKYRRSKIATI